MFNDILIGVTNFFRDRDFVVGSRKTGASRHSSIRNVADDEVRVWSIGCATGEEAYSLAILLFEQAARRISAHISRSLPPIWTRVQFHAREGLYPAAIEADVSPERLERFFTAKENITG